MTLFQGGYVKKILLSLLLALSLLECMKDTPPDGGNLKVSLPIGARTIRVDKNQFTFFQLGDRYYAAYNQNTYGFTFITIIFEVDKSAAFDRDQ